MNRHDPGKTSPYKIALGVSFLLFVVGGCDVSPNFSSGSSGGCGGGGFGTGGGYGTLHVEGCPDPGTEGTVWIGDLDRIEGAYVDLPVRVRTTADSVRAFGFSLTFPPKLEFRGVVPSGNTQGWSIDHSVTLQSVLVSGALADSSAVPVKGYGALAVVQFRVDAPGDGGAFVFSLLGEDIAEYRACPAQSEGIW